MTLCKSCNFFTFHALTVRPYFVVRIDINNVSHKQVLVASSVIQRKKKIEKNSAITIYFQNYKFKYILT